MSPLRSEVEGRDMAHQVMVEPSEDVELLLSLVRADASAFRSHVWIPDWTARFRPVAAALGELKATTAYLDGEVAVLGSDGVTSFARLQDALSKNRSGDLVYFVFDLLHLDGCDLRPLPLLERKAALKKLLGRRRAAGPIRYSDHVEGQGGGASSCSGCARSSGRIRPLPRCHEITAAARAGRRPASWPRSPTRTGRLTM
jgi:hypothetical protein